MSLHPEQFYQPPTSEDFIPFVKKDVVPAVDASQLNMGLFVGEQRAGLKTATTGEMSLLLEYKEREAFVTSFADQGEALGIVQLQGATRGKGYRVATGLHLVRLFASQIQEITAHPESPYREIYMPPVFMIEGVEVAISDMVGSRYEALASELGMKFSAQEQLFLKKLK